MEPFTAVRTNIEVKCPRLHHIITASVVIAKLCKKKKKFTFLLFPRLQRDYCSYALENLTYVLIREIFSPLSPRRHRESRSLCRKMRRDPLYREAFRYTLSTGILPRRVLAGAFWLRCYLLTALISRVSYAWLERR